MSRRSIASVRRRGGARAAAERLEPRILMAATPRVLVDFSGDLVTANQALRTAAVTSLADFNGDTTTDSRTAYPLSLTTPISPASGYTGKPFYGSVVGTSFDNTTINSNFSDRSVINTGSADQLSLRYQPSGQSATGAGSTFDSLWLWQKPDFVSAGTGALTLSTTSSFKLTLTRWDSSVTTGRWVVRSGGQLYVSNATFNNPTNGTYTVWFVGTLVTGAMWAPYNPSGSAIDFDQSAATYSTPTSGLSDIDAVGFLTDADSPNTAVRYWVGFSVFKVALVGGLDSFDVNHATYVAGAGTDDGAATDVAPDGTVVYAGTIDPGYTPGGVTPVFLNGATGTSGGAVVRMASDGKTVLSVTRVAQSIADMEIAPDGRIALATGGSGVVVLNPDASAVVWSDTANPNVKRVSIGLDGDVAGLATLGSFNHQVRYYNANGSLNATRGFGDSFVEDVAVDSARKLVIVTGFNNKNTGQEPAQVAFIRAFSTQAPGSLPLVWKNYDWSGATLRNEQNPNVADTRGYRVSIGRDGYLYYGGESHGGNSTYLYDPQQVSLVLTPQRLVGYDAYSQGYNTASNVMTFLARYDPATGALDRGQFVLARLSDGSGNSHRPRGLTADEYGRVLVSGASASQIKDRAAKAINDLPLNPYVGFEMIYLRLKQDFSAREAWTAFTGGPASQNSQGNGVATRYGLGAIVGTALNTTAEMVTTPDAPRSTRQGGNDGYYVSYGTWVGTTPTVAGLAAGDQWRLRLDPTGNYFQLFRNDDAMTGLAYWSTARATLNGLNLSGLGGTGRLTIDLANGNPVPAGGLTFANGSAGGSVRVAGDGSTAAVLTVSGTTAGAGMLVVGGRTVQFTGATAGVALASLASVGYATPNGADTLTITGQATDTGRIGGSSGGLTLATVDFTNVATLTLDLAEHDAGPAADDALTIAASGLIGAGLLRLSTGTGNNTLTQQGGVAEIDVGSAGLVNASLDASVSGGGVLSLVGRTVIRGLLVGGGSTARMSSGAGVLAVESLSLDATGVLTLRDADVVVTGGLADSTLTQWVRNGITGQPGAKVITEITAGGPEGAATTLAVFANAGPALGQWEGVGLTTASVVGKYTYFGDANIDGVVDDADYGVVDAFAGSSATSWLFGDLNFDFATTDEDYGVIDAFIGAGTGAPLAVAPGGAARPIVGVAAWRVWGGLFSETHVDTDRTVGGEVLTV